jgi:formyltetrahydrofolate deformylase
VTVTQNHASLIVQGKDRTGIVAAVASVLAGYGAIVEHDVVRVTHADSVADLARRGADVERQVLSRAVKWHSEDRVIRNGHHTIVFP